MVEPAGGVEARAESEGHVLGGCGPVGNPAGLDQRDQARSLRAADQLEPGLGQDAVVLKQGNHVRDGAECHQVAERAQVGLGAALPETVVAQMLAQGDGQAEGDADAGQVLEAGWAVAAFGVDDRHRRRKGGWHVVVIGDDHVDPGGARRIHRGVASRSAIHGDHQRGLTRYCDLCHVAGLEAVAFLQSMGDVVGDAGPAGFQELEQNGCGGRAVHVVVAEQQDVLPGRDGPGNSMHGLVQVFQTRGRSKLGERCVEKCLCLLRRIQTAVDQNGRDHRVTAQGVGQGADRVGVRSHEVPVLFHGHSL